MRILARLVVIFVIGFAVGCSSKPTTSTYKMDNVVRVFMHEPRRYTFSVQDPESKELSMVSLNGNFSILVDVPADKPMWVDVTDYTGDDGCQTYHRYTAVVHIHSEKNLDGAGWNHGKFGQGQTQVIK